MNDNINFKDLNLSKETLKSLEKLGYASPTDVQSKIIPIALTDVDVIVKSQTGSGKTATFAIPLCEKVDLGEKSPQALILTPTRELAVQVKEDIYHIGLFKRIRCCAVFGKNPIKEQEKELKQKTHIVVGTPGRTFDHIERGNIDLKKIKYLIIDEADEMLNMGFIDQVEAIIKKLSKNRVTMLFSATMPDEIEKICENYMISPQKIEIESKTPTTIKIAQGYYKVDESKKFSLLTDLIYTEMPESCILFCNTRDSVNDLFKKMKANNYSCAALHGGMEQRNRLDTISQFKKGKFDYLIATDVAARGIHVENISHVINYEVPKHKENYVHRIGRTGRAECDGIALTFVSSSEARRFEQIEEYIGYEICQKNPPASEDVAISRKLIEKSKRINDKIKSKKTKELNREITKIRINAGKKKKMRSGDILGALTKINGITGDDIGIINVQDTCSYIDIIGKGPIVLKELKNIRIKGKPFTFKEICD